MAQLLFNKDDNGTTEIHSLLGFLSKNIKFQNLAADIYTYTDLMVELIGLPIYNEVFSIYQAASPNEDQLDLLRRVRTAILRGAYYSYAQDNDLLHSTNGRVNSLEENQKIAWEWQIDASNKKLEKDYYRDLDQLIKYLDKNSASWKQTDLYKSSRELFLRVPDDFDMFFTIGQSRLLYLKLVPGVRQAQSDFILPVLGQQAYDELIVSLKENSGIDNKLLNICKEICAYHSLYWGLPKLSLQYFPDAIAFPGDNSRIAINSRKAVETSFIKDTANQFMSDRDKAVLKLTSYIQSLQAVQRPIESIEEKFNQNDNVVSL